MNLHNNIRLLRQARGWSQEEMATRLEMSTNGYGSIERGETDISLSRIKQIACVLNLEVTGLFIGNQSELAQMEVPGCRVCSVCPLPDVETDKLHSLLTEINTLMGSMRFGG
ncbi:MAG: helix-turn-helix domain-containing protein [Methylococcaceae bacterium]